MSIAIAAYEGRRVNTTPCRQYRFHACLRRRENDGYYRMLFLPYCVAARAGSTMPLAYVAAGGRADHSARWLLGYDAETLLFQMLDFTLTKLDT